MAKTKWGYVTSKNKKYSGNTDESYDSRKFTDRELGYLKSIMEKEIGFDTFESDLQSTNQTINSVYGGWHSQDAMSSHRATLENMNTRIKSYQDYQKIFGGGADISDLAKGYRSVLGEWDSLAEMYGSYDSEDSYNKAKRMYELGEKYKGSSYEDILEKRAKILGANTKSIVGAYKEAYADSKELEPLKSAKSPKEMLDALKGRTDLLKKHMANRDIGMEDDEAEFLLNYTNYSTLYDFDQAIEEAGKDSEYGKKLVEARKFATPKILEDDVKIVANLDQMANEGKQIIEGRLKNQKSLLSDGSTKVNQEALRNLEAMGTPEQKETYYALLGMSRWDDADTYLNALADQLAYASAEERYEKYYEDRPLLQYASAPFFGVGNFVRNISNNGKDAHEMGYTDTQYLEGMVRDEIADDSKIGQVAFDLGNTIGNMAPAIGAGWLVSHIPGGQALGGKLIGTAAAATSSGLMGLSARGGAIQEKVNEGWDFEDAKKFGTISGTSEAVTNLALGGISKLGGKLTNKSIKAMATGIDNAFLRYGATMGIRMSAEAIEEGYQSFAEPFYENLALGYDKNDWDDVDWEQVGYDAMLGALSVVPLDGVGTAKYVFGENQEAKKLGATIRENEMAGKMFDIASLTPEESDAYNLYTNYANKGVTSENASDLQLGRLWVNSKRQTQETLADKRKSNAEASLKAVNTDADLDYVARKKSPIEKRVAELTTKTETKTPLEEGVAIKGIKLGEDTKIVTDKGEMSVSEVALPKRQAEIVARAEQMTETEANLFVSQYDGTTDIEEYSDSFNLAVAYSRNAMPQDAILEHKGVLTERQVAEIYKATRTAVVQENQNAIDNITQKHSKGTFLKGKFDDTIIDYKSATTDKSKVNWSSLTSKQRSAIKFAKMFSKATGVNIILTQKKNVNGKLVGANGSYDPNTNTITLDVYAGRIDAMGVKDAIIPTLSHEVTHWMKAKSPAIYERIKNELVPFLAKKQGLTIDELVENEIDRIKNAHPEIDVTPDYAMDELVARACEDMLANSSQAKSLLAKMTYEERNSFVGKIQKTLKNLIEWVDELLSYYKSESVEAKTLREYRAELKKVSKMWDEMLVSAVEANQALQKEGVIAEDIIDEIAEAHAIQFNEMLVESHIDKLKESYSADANISLDELLARYDKIVGIWKKLGGELNSQFLEDWNKQIGKDRTFSVFKAQAGYKYNVELSSMCKKGIPLFEAIDTIVKKEVIKELNSKTLGKAEKEILYDILKEHHFEIPCAICYVEQARQREGVIIDAFLNGKIEKTNTGKVTQFKLGWNETLVNIQNEMKSAGFDYTFPSLDRSISTENYSPSAIAMDEEAQEHFYEALKKVANAEIRRYNKENNKSRKLITKTDANSIKEVFKGKLPLNLAMFKVMFTEPSSRFTIDEDLLYSSMTTQNLASMHNGLYSLFNSQGGVGGYKTKQGTIVYWADILGKKWKPEDLRNEGGVRNQSNSDFLMYTLLDHAQMYIDFSAKGYYLQAYTKVLSELKLFGLSKGKINASFIPKVVVYYNADGTVDVEKTMLNAGLDENGNPIYDDIEGINHNEAFMLLEDAEYSKNIGGVCIGYSDNHILKLLDDNRIQQIIGFHDKTNDGEKRYRGAKYAKNYNGLNEATKLEKDGTLKTVHIGFNKFVRQAENKFSNGKESIEYKGKTYTYNDIPKLATDLYLAHCESKGLFPAYSQGGVDFSKHPNYYKLLADFSLYDINGNYAPHQKVEYNMPDQVPYLDKNGKKAYMSTESYIKNELQKEIAVRDSISEALADDSANGIIPQFVKRANEPKNKYYSDADSYMDAVDKGDMVTAQKLVDEKAKESGFSTKVFHGTTGFGWTKADVRKSDDGISVFATDSLELARTYSGAIGETAIKGKRISNETEQLYNNLVTSFVNKVNEIAGTDMLKADELPFDRYLSRVKKGKMNSEQLSNEMTKFTMGVIDKIENISQESDNLIWEMSGELENTLYGVSGRGGNYGLYANTDGFLEIDGKGSKWSSIPFDKIPSKTTANTREIVKWAKDNGYSGVLFKDIIDIGYHGTEQKQPANVYAFLNPQEQLKSADPVTYNAFGKVIPLSERFNKKKRDIRYSDAESLNDACDTLETISDEEYEKAKKVAPFVLVMHNTPQKVLDAMRDVNPDVSIPVNNRKVLIRRDALYLAIRNQGIQAGNYHGLGADTLKRLPEYLEHPDAILKTNESEKRCLVLSHINTKNGQAIISVEFESPKEFEGHNDFFNVIVTVFDLHENYMKRLFRKYDAEIKYEKEDLEQVNPQLHTWLRTFNSKSSTDSLSQEDAKSQEKNSDQMNETVYDKMGEAKRLEKENARIKKDLANLKERLSIEGKVTGGTAVLSKDTDVIARYIDKIANSTLDKDSLSDELKELYTYMRESSMDGTWSEEAVFAKAYELAEKVMTESTPKTVPNDYAKFLLREIKSKRISLSETQKQEAKNAFGKDWYKSFFGKVTIANNGISLDSQWQEWASQYPDFFKADVNEGDQITALYKIYDDLKDVSEIVQEYNAEEQTRYLAEEIINKCWTIPVRFTIADKYDAQIKQLKFEHRQSMKEVRDSYEDRMKEQHKLDKAKYSELVQKVRDRKDAEISRAKELGKERLDKYKENAERKTVMQSILSKTTSLSKKLLTNDKDVHIPESLKPVVTKIIDTIDFSSKQLLGMGHTPKDSRGMPTKMDAELEKRFSRARAMADEDVSLYDAISEASKLFEKSEKIMASTTDGTIDMGLAILDADLKEKLGDLKDNVHHLQDKFGKAFILQNMSLEDLKTLNGVVHSINHWAIEADKMRSLERTKSLFELALKTVEEDAKMKGYTEYIKGIETVRKFLEWDNLQPAQAFDRLGETGKEIYNALLDAMERQAFNEDVIEKFTKELFKGHDIKKWQTETKSFDLQLWNGEKKTVELPISFVMTLYCVSKQEDAKRHLFAIDENGNRYNDGGGMTIASYTDKSKKGIKGVWERAKVKNDTHNTVLVQKNLDQITSVLTKEQRDVADAMQKFMNETGSNWGNAVSEVLYGIKKFDIEDYFPITVSPTTLKQMRTDGKESTHFFSILNYGFTKSRNPNAKQSIEIGDIFDVFAKHMKMMAIYNAWAVPVYDMVRWFNFTGKDADGNEIGVKKSIQESFGKSAINYITTLVEDLNGQHESSRLGFIQKIISNTKVALVGNSLSVALLQPTAIVKASTIINPIYIGKSLLYIKDFGVRRGRERAKEYNGFALLKSKGKFDMGVSTDETRRLLNQTTATDKIKEASLWGAGKGDEFTLGLLWNACEFEVKAKQKDLKVGSKEYFDAVSKRLRDIIVRTQVVDTPLTKSHLMRSGDTGAKSITMFASEITSAYNLVSEAFYQAAIDKRKNGKGVLKRNAGNIARAVTVYALTSATVALFQTFIDNFRDNDDDEKYLEDYWNQYKENFFSDVSLFSKIPYVKDYISNKQGFNSSRTETLWMENMVKAVNYAKKAQEGKDGAGLKSLTNALKALSDLTGLPGYNQYRDAVATLDSFNILEAEDIEKMIDDLMD